ncbi:alpha/beta fold hydrolase [Mycobacterium sp. E3251]|uniref:alpha/beta fold hydrolase n=1 Tax=Mycobacterium sp. E3251 TaxID=1834144 RepID=UPI0009EF3EE3|nr:alpha/beta hydrolase [Mycobacterium sp. E3251]
MIDNAQPGDRPNPKQTVAQADSRWFPGFDAGTFDTDGTAIYARWGGNPGGPALLLVHGYPETHLMWRHIAGRLRDRYFLVIPDLRGYGASAKPVGLPDHSNYSKRTMANDLVAVVDQLGRDSFYLCGHDRGARVAARLALDHPHRVRKLSLIDIAPTLDMYRATNQEFATAYFHWFLLIQAAPLPELLIGGNPAAYLAIVLRQLSGGNDDYLEREVIAEYERAFCTPETLHSTAEDYRASAGIDLEHDQHSRDRGHRIACDTQVLTAENGAVHRLFDAHALWQAQCAATVTTTTLPSGHFIPETLPDETAAALSSFFPT